MHHCNDGEFYLGPWPFEHFYHQPDKGDGFIKFESGTLPGGPRSEIRRQYQDLPSS